MQNKKLWILLGGLVILGWAFLFLNFRMAVSNTQSENHITTTGIGEGLPYAMQRREKISLAVVGEGPLVHALQKALDAEMHGAGIGEIEFVEGLEPAHPNPVLVIQVGQPGLLWTPVFATSQFSLRAHFASSGDTSFMGDTLATMDNRNGPALMRYAEYKISDRSWGLISRLGYHQLLADYLAQQILAAVKDLY